MPKKDITPVVTLADLQKEMCPRISANDLTELLRHQHNDLMCLDIRSTSDYNRVHLPYSINIPYNYLQLEEKSLETLNVPQIEEKLHNRIIICISNIHENAVQVSNTKHIKLILLICNMFSFLSFRNFW